MKSPLSRRIRLFHVLVALVVACSLISPHGMFRVFAQDPDPSGKISSERSILDRAPEPTPQILPTEEPLVDVPHAEDASQHIPAGQIHSELLDEAPLRPGDVARIRVIVEASGELLDPTLRLVLPDGFTWPGHETAVVTEPLDTTQRGGVQERELALQMTEAARDVNVLRLELWSANAQGPAVTEVEVRRVFEPSEVQISAGQGGELHSADARVTVRVPESATGRDVRVEHRPVSAERLQSKGAELALQFELNAFADDESGAPMERFDQPLELRVDLTGLVDLLALKYYQHPFLGYWDQESQEWVAVAFRQERNVLVAEVDHLSLWGAGTTVGTNTGWMLPANEAAVSLFDGGLMYDYPLQLPDGGGGLQPSLSLSYNSRRLDGVVTWVQSDWLGMGWTVDTMEIVRDAFRPQYTSYPGGNPDFSDGRVQWGNRYSLLYKGTVCADPFDAERQGPLPHRGRPVPVRRAAQQPGLGQQREHGQRDHRILGGALAGWHRVSFGLQSRF